MHNLKPHAPFFTLVCIIILAFIVRVMNMDAIRHNIDHAYPIWQAMRTIDYGIFPVVGQATSVLFANPALTGYLYIPALWIDRSPVAVYLLVIILNTAAVAFAWVTARTLFKDWRLAAFTAFIVALNPWIVEYSRTTWVQSLMPFFVCGIAALLAVLITGAARRPLAVTISVLLLLTAFSQTYLLAFFLAAPVALLLIIFRKRVDWRGVGIGAVVFALITAIYAAGIISGSGSGLERVDEFADAPSRLSTEALTHGLRLVSGEGYAATRSALLPDVLGRVSGENLSQIIFIAFIAMGFISALYAIWKRTDRYEAGVFTVVWFVLPIIAMSYTGNKVHPFYLLLSLPAGAMLAAWGMGYLLRWRVLAVFVVIGLAAWGVLSILNLQAFATQTRQTPTNENLNALPLADGLTLGATLDANLPDPGIIYSSVNEWILNVFTGRLFPVIGGIQTSALTYIPHSGGIKLTYLTESEVTNEPNTPFAETVAVQDFIDGPRLIVERFPPQIIDQGRFDALPIPSDAGITLIDYTLRERRNGVYFLNTRWRIDQTTAQTGQYFYGTFVHVFNENGERIVNTGGQPVSGLLWNTGDVIVERLRFTVEGEPDRFEFGLFDINSGRNAVFILPESSEQVTRLTIQME